MLITDGQDNDGSVAKTEEMKIRYVEENVVIDAVAFSNTAEENLISLQEATGNFKTEVNMKGSLFCLHFISSLIGVLHVF